MARQNHDQETVRRYLLKKLSDAEQQDVARRILTDDEFSTELEIAEDELIDEYVTHELSRPDRARFQQDFLTTPERLSKLKSAQTLKRYFDRVTPEPNPKRRTFLPKWPALSFVQGPDSVAFFSSRAVMAITLLLVGVAGVIIWRVAIYKSDVQKGLMALNDAYRQERPIEARVSTLDYAPFISTRSGNESVPVNNFELDRAQRFLSDAEKDRADAASAHAMGKLYLMRKDFDKAIEYLERASKTDSKNPQIYADLGAAYLEKGRLELDASKSKEPNQQSGKGLADLGQSLEYLKQSLELDPNLLEALFNRGLVHEQQGLYQEAENDWRAYIDKDSSSQWAVDARQKLKTLEDRKNRVEQDTKSETFMRAYYSGDETPTWEIFRRSYAGTGNSVIKDLLDHLLANEGGDESSTNLRALTYLGQLETRNSDDYYTADLAHVYASASPQTRELLLQARRQIEEGDKLSRQSFNKEAIELFTSAQKTFDSVGDVPESLAAGIAIVSAAVLQPDLEKAQEVVASLAPACEEKRYKWLLGQALIKRAHIQSNVDNYSEAIKDSDRALLIFQELKDLNGILLAFNQLANLHLFLNDCETSFSFLKRAMSIVDEQRASPTTLWGVYIAASLNLSALKLYRAALDYQHEALQIALTSKIPLYISRSYQYIGLTYGALRQFDLAFENVRRAHEQGKSRETERAGKNMMANASLRLGDLYRVSGDEASALAAYEESSQLFKAVEFDHYSYPAHKGKFLSYLAQNNDALAEQELEIILKLLEKYREKIVEDRQTSYFFDKEQDICDLAIDFTYFRLNDQHRAFDRAEICRARNLHRLIKHGAKVTPGASGLDLRSSQPLESGNASPLTGAEIQQQIPKQVQIVQYAVLEKRLLVWCITNGHEPFTRFIEVDSSTLKDLVTTALNQIRQRDDKGSADSLRRLYDLLIAPISSQLDPNKVLCFIPDESLHSLPFGALMSTSGHYLAQDYQLMTSPSSTIFIESTNRAQERSSVQEERLLAVGNPTFDRSSNPSLSNLASAEGEVKQIARDYPPHARVLIGPQATRTSVMDELPRAQVAHFAAHYQIDPQSPLSSKVLLSPEPGDRAHAQPSALVSADIYQMDLTGTRLVVLSACQTGVEQELRGEGAIGFARSFLVAGVPVVVASLWPVDSEATTELMISFHYYRRVKHLHTTEALKSAQKEMMTHEKYNNPYYWAGFTAIGGYSEF